MSFLSAGLVKCEWCCFVDFWYGLLTGRASYLAAFGNQILDTFFRTVNQWEHDAVVEKLKVAKVSLEEPFDLNNIPTGILFHILNNPALCIETNDVSTSLRRSFAEVVESLTKEPVPVGLLILALDKDDKTRSWAQKQLTATKTDSGLMDFKTYHAPTIEALVDVCGDGSRAALLSPHFLSLVPDVDRWDCVASVIEAFPTPLIRDGLTARKFLDAFKRAVKWLHEAKECE